MEKYYYKTDASKKLKLNINSLKKINKILTAKEQFDSALVYICIYISYSMLLNISYIYIYAPIVKNHKLRFLLPSPLQCHFPHHRLHLYEMKRSHQNYQ